MGDLILLDYKHAERSFSHFVRAAWALLEPSTPLLWNWHHELICEYLEAVLAGDVKRLIINMPPRYMKSIIVTVLFPAWCWIRSPSMRFISTSYSQMLSTKHSVDRRLVLESPWYQAAWGSTFKLSDDQNQKMEYTNDKRGHMVATSMLGTVTGKGGDCIIVDDPHNPKKAESELERQAAVEAFDSTFTTRLDDKKTGRMIVVMQRLHEKDLTGHLLAKGGWEHLCLPAEAPARTVIKFPRSAKEIVREQGDLLHEARDGKPELEAQKVALGSYGYAGQYDQAPAPRVGGLFKRHYWRFYSKLPERLESELQSWDLAFKGKDDSDFVAGVVMGRVVAGADVYIIDLLNERLGFKASCSAVRSLSQKHPRALLKLVEDKANGPGLVDVLKSEIPGLVLVNPEGSKWERACSIEPMLEAGNVFLPAPEIAPKIMHNGQLTDITTLIINQCAVFPRGDHDDIVDALTQGLKRLQRKSFDRFLALGKS